MPCFKRISYCNFEKPNICLFPLCSPLTEADLELGLKRAAKREEFYASLFVLAILLIIIKRGQHVWVLSQREDLVNRLIFVHRCVMATSVSWDTLPGVIELHDLRIKQLKLLDTRSISFAASLTRWKLKWLPEKQEELSKVESKHSKDGQWVGNKGKEAEPSPDGGKYQQQVEAEGDERKKDAESPISIAKYAEILIREPEFEEREIMYTSGGEAQVMKSTRVGYFQALVLVSANV